jgi:hypothetical protein
MAGEAASGEFRDALIFNQHPGIMIAALGIGIHLVAQGAGVDAQVRGDLRDRLPDLPDQPHRTPWPAGISGAPVGPPPALR